MSVNFWMEQAAQVRYQPEPIDDPEWWSIKAAEPFIEINLGNANAVAIAREVDPELLHYDEDGVSVWGDWDMAKLEKIHARLMVLLNMQKKQEPLYFDPFISKEPGRCTVYGGGRDEEYVQRTLTRLLELVVVAREHQFPVSIG
jgi:hypothetical protein